MFSWIKNLKSAGSKKAAPSLSQGIQQTRVVKRIVPASLKEAEAALPPPLPTTPTLAPSQPTLRVSPSPALPKKKLPIAFPGGAPAPVAPPPAPVSISEEEEEAEPAPVIHEVAPAPAKPPTIRLASSTRIAMPRTASGSAPVPSKEIVLTIGDFVSKIPGHFINESAVNRNQEVHFDAADLYSDMSKGRATVPLSIIAENVPHLFKRQLSPEEDVEIQLPLSKIVAQMSEFLTRGDQEEAESYDEIDTPFSKAAERDGTVHRVSGAVTPEAPAPIPISIAVPTPAPVPVAPPAPAPAPAARESAPPPPPETFRPKLKPVSFKPASETIAAAAAPAPAPTAVPLSILPTSPEPAPAPKGKKVRDDGRRVTVRVRPLIQALPMDQRESLLGSIPEDSQVDLPLAEIEDQLPNGRVVLPFSTFAAALKPELRSTFANHYTGEDMPISLSEIIRNLPNDTLSLREDQVIEEVDPNEFETPFNTTPNEIPVPKSVPVAPPTARPQPPAALRPKPMITPAVASPVSFTTKKLNTDTSYPSPMHAALMTHDALDAKKVVKLASGFPGVAGMTVITSDGLSLAGNLPAFMNPEGFTAMTPHLMKRVAGSIQEMKLGELHHLTVYTDNHTVTVLTSGQMSLAVLHQNQADFGHGVREKLVAIVRELEKQYSH